MSGKIINPKYGDKAQTFDFELIDERVSLDAWLPPEVINNTFFPDAPESSVGFPMNVLHGYPHVVCPLIKDDGTTKSYLIAGHHCHAYPGGYFSSDDPWTKIFIEPAEGDTDAERGVIADQDGSLGVSIVNGNVRDFGDGDMAICYVQITSALFGGIPDDAIIGAKIVGMGGDWGEEGWGDPTDYIPFTWSCAYTIYRLYTDYTGFGPDKVDKGSFEGAFQKGLHKWRFNSCFNGFGSNRTKTIDTIHRRLLPQVPAFEYYKNGKLGLAFVDIWDNEAESAMSKVLDEPGVKMYLEYGFNVLDRLGKVEEGSADDIRNDFIIKYHLDIFNKTGGWTHVLHITHGQDIQFYEDPSASVTIEVIKSERCRTSYEKFGHCPGDTIYCIDIPYNNPFAAEEEHPSKTFRTAAHMLGEWLVYMFTYRPKYLNVLCNNSCLLAEPGDFVKYVDPNLAGFETGKICLVLGKDIGLDKVKLRLRTWENMMRKGAATIG